MKDPDDFDFDKEVERLGDCLIRLAEKLWPRDLRSEHSPEDLAGDALRCAYERRDQFRGRTGAALWKWLEAIIENRIKNHFRDRGRRPAQERLGSGDRLPQKPRTTPSRKLIREEDQERVRNSLKLLKDDQRQAWELHLEGRSCQETAEIMGIPEYSVYRLLGRGRIKLLRLLAEPR